MTLDDPRDPDRSGCRDPDRQRIQPPRTPLVEADPTLIAEDERRFAAIAESLEHSIADLSQRLDAARRAPGGEGQAAMDRDMEVHRLTARLHTLQRFGLDLCLGRMVGDDGAAPVYIGRLGLTGRDGDRLLVDWRSPAAEPFFGATHANAMGLASRRRYRWSRGRINDYWDEVFTPGGLQGHAALDDQSAFIASLGSNRSSRMRDVLATIQADQDAAAVVETDPGVARLKAPAALVKAIAPAVAFHEQPPTKPMTIETPWADIPLNPDDWAEAFAAAEPGATHNEARGQVWELVLEILLEKFLDSHDGIPAALVRRSLLQNEELLATMNRAWPLLDPANVVADLWTVPAYLQLCAPWLASAEVRALRPR